METLILEQAYYIGELFGIVAVVISLIFVGIQLRQNTKATNLGTLHAIAQGFREQYALVGSSTETANVFTKGLINMDELDRAERVQFFAHLHNLFRIFEDAHYQYKEGALDPELWKGMNQQFIDFKTMDGIQKYWQQRHHYYSGPFQKFYNEIVLASEATSGFIAGGNQYEV